jgi:glycosyltransferase involved in cell wall biosynthesis
MVKTVSVIGANGVPASYGGWDQLVEAFSKVDREDLRFVIFCSHKTNSGEHAKHNNAKVEVVRLDANGWQSIPYDIISLCRAFRISDITIMLGTSGCVALPLFRLLGHKVILNIDGAEWRRGKWNFFIKIFLKISEFLGVKNSELVISDNAVITEYVEQKYFVKPETIAYGADHIVLDVGRRDYGSLGLEKGKYFFKVCRIVPENNLELILSAFSKSHAQFVLVGNFLSSDFGIKLRKKFSVHENLHLLDPIYDQETLNAYRSNAGVYVHGHSVGGSNPSLIEAMYLGLNIFSYDVNYNRETTKQFAHFYKSEDDLLGLISKFHAGELIHHGKGAQKIARDQYTWKKIMARYLEVIDSIGEKV